MELLVACAFNICDAFYGHTFVIPPFLFQFYPNKLFKTLLDEGDRAREKAKRTEEITQRTLLT